MCEKRFTTYEKIGEGFKLNVIKKDGSRLPYDRDKLISGLQKACYKRPVSVDEIQEVADKVEEMYAEGKLLSLGMEYGSYDSDSTRPSAIKASFGYVCHG